MNLEHPSARRVTFSALATCVLLLASTALVAQGTPPSCDTPEHAQFDFWEGNWKVEQPGGAAAGTNRIEKILNGCVLLENWTGSGGSIGKSFNMYDRRDQKWKQTWVDGVGSRLDLVGGWADGKMILEGETPGRDGKPIRHEVTWTPRDDGTVLQHWRSSRDGGATWADSFKGIYVRDGKKKKDKKKPSQ